MTANYNKSTIPLIISFICIAYGLLGSIHYYEDIDSLRFALGVKHDFDISKMQPHFPCYPIFIFLAKIIFSVTNNLGLTFSLIGSASSFIIIFFVLKMLKIKKVIDTFLIIFIVLFNPLFSIMSARYMPDMFGLSVCVAIFYFILFSRNKLKIHIGLFLFGLLFGIRLSYVPVVFIPIVYAFFKSRDRGVLLLLLLAGLLLWLIPLISLEGIQPLLIAGESHTSGHFNDYGGSILTERNLLLRLISLIQAIWSDGLGGYWADRSYITLLVPASLGSILLFGNQSFKREDNHKFLILAYSFFFYLIYIFLFQNVIYKSRHTLPAILIILLFLLRSYPLNLNLRKYMFVLISWFIISTVITLNHKNGTAINQAKEFIQSEKPDCIISTPLINQYLRSNGIVSRYIDIEKEIKLDTTISKNVKIFTIGEFRNRLGINFKDSIFFHHNYYMNRMWSTVPIYIN